MYMILIYIYITIHVVKNGFTWNVPKWNFPKCPAEGNYSRLDRLVVLPSQAGTQYYPSNILGI